MNNFMPPLKIRTVPKVRSDKKTENPDTAKSKLCNITKKLSELDDFLNINIVFSNKN